MLIQHEEHEPNVENPRFGTTGGVREAHSEATCALEVWLDGTSDRLLTYLNIKLQSASSSGSGKICPDWP